MEENIKEEKKQAKLQDKAYVDYRKAEILHDIKPRTKAFNLKKFDDSFPRPNKKKEANMEYGELMHKYLMMRPDPRFATWLGKTSKKKKIVGGEVAAAPEKKGVIHRMTQVVATKQTKQASPAPVAKKNYTQAVKKVLQQQQQGAEVEEDESDRLRLKEAEKYLPKAEVDAKNKYALNAIVENKPFWLIGDPLVPEDEDEAYVDAEMVTNYIANPDTTAYPHNSAERQKFFLWGPVPQLWNETKQYQNKKLVIGNTLKSIVESSADKMGIAKERVDKGHKPVLTWQSKTRTIDYVMDSVPLEKTAIYEGKLQNIRKEDAKKE